MAKSRTRSIWSLALVLAPSLVWAQEGYYPAPGNVNPSLANSEVQQAANWNADNLARNSLYDYYSSSAQVHQPTVHPKDPAGPARMYMPTPVRGHDHYGVPDLATDMRPDSNTINFSLMNRYGLVRSVDYGSYMTEYGSTHGAGVTLLPFQAPCWLIGLRLFGGVADNHSLREDRAALSMDLFAGTRYKTFYGKFGVTWDSHETYGKTGFAAGFLVPFPVLRNLVFEGNWTYGYGSDVIGPARGDFGRLRRVEAADFDTQLRIGTFLTRNIQVGAVGQYYDWDYAPSEYSAGAYLNWFVGKARVGLEFAGGSEGARGMVTVGWNFGVHPHEATTDCNIPCVDVHGWLSRAFDRDLTVKNRYSWSGF